MFRSLAVLQLALLFGRHVDGLAWVAGKTKTTSEQQQQQQQRQQHFTDLCHASSLSYLPLATLSSSDYAVAVPYLTPLAQIVEPRTESGATLFRSDDDDDTIVVACRGSATPKNFATNLRFTLTPLSCDPTARAHEGFQEAAAGLWTRLSPLLAETRSDKVVFTGHSLGGGTAELCALHAAASGNVDVTAVVTFGGPRIGDAAFARYANDALSSSGTIISHVVHGADPILANNGPLWDRLGFRRSGTEVRCDPDTATLFSKEEKDDIRVRMVPWNIVDHCRYLGIYLGPRL